MVALPFTLNPFMAILASVVNVYAPVVYRAILYVGMTGDSTFADVRNRVTNDKSIAASDKPAAKRIRWANAAHLNGFESLALLIPSILCCIIAGVDTATISYWATLHLLTRVAFNLYYIFINVFPGRSILFAAGMFICIRMLLLASEAKYGAALL